MTSFTIWSNIYVSMDGRCRHTITRQWWQTSIIYERLPKTMSATSIALKRWSNNSLIPESASTPMRVMTQQSSPSKSVPVLKKSSTNGKKGPRKKLGRNSKRCHQPNMPYLNPIFMSTAPRQLGMALLPTPLKSCQALICCSNGWISCSSNPKHQQMLDAREKKIKTLLASNVQLMEQFVALIKNTANKGQPGETTPKFKGEKACNHKCRHCWGQMHKDSNDKCWEMETNVTNHPKGWVS